MRNWAWNFLKSPLLLKRIQLIVLIMDFIGDAALPRLDFVEMLFGLVVSAFADVDGTVIFINTFGTSSRVTREEHYEALA